jgi:ribosomal-protein-alanine N-acetyltransferase
MFPEISTPRLQMRVLQTEDLTAYQQYLTQNREHLRPWEPERNESFFSDQECIARISLMHQHTEAATAIPFSLFMGRDMIGVCNFSNIVQGVFQACHLGYAISAAHQGKGLMREAVEAGIHYMFEKQNLHRIMANYRPENLRSAALLDSLGFEREGFAKRYLKINGVWCDHVLTAKVRDDE